MKEYRPLPEYLDILPSNIEGKGLFVTKDFIDCDFEVILGKTHTVSNGKIERTPIGGFINNSLTPNCRIDETYSADLGKDQTPEYYLMLEKPVKVGEELTVNYNDVPICGYSQKQIDSFNEE